MTSKVLVRLTPDKRYGLRKVQVKSSESLGKTTYKHQMKNMVCAKSRESLVL